MPELDCKVTAPSNSTEMNSFVKNWSPSEIQSSSITEKLLSEPVSSVTDIAYKNATFQFDTVTADAISGHEKNTSDMKSIVTCSEMQSTSEDNLNESELKEEYPTLNSSQISSTIENTVLVVLDSSSIREELFPDTVPLGTGDTSKNVIFQSNTVTEDDVSVTPLSCKVSGKFDNYDDSMSNGIVLYD